MTNNNKHSYSQLFVVFGAILGALGIILGAFGAHALKDGLDQRGMVSVWDTAVKYQMYHAVALLAQAAWVEARSATVPPAAAFSRAMRGVARCFVVGTVLFSGSLYLLALGAPTWLGPITPLGGLALLAGWIWLAVAAWRN